MNSPTKTRQSAIGNRQSTIAWCGWQIDVPEDWRPLKIQGESDKGSMMIGDADRPLLLVQWRRTGNSNFDAENWMESRFKKQRVMPDAGAPQPKGFQTSSWARAIEVLEGESKSVWYGYSSSAGLLLELVTARLTAAHGSREILDEVLPVLCVTRKVEPCRWSIFDVAFVSPVGFELERRHLYSGDIALCMAKGRHEHLLLRQVYPAGVALSRRSLNAWYEAPPFTQRRRPPKEQPRPWKKDGLEGIRRNGWRRLPSPMGWCNPRYSNAAMVVDEKLDRLLIVEHQTRREQDDKTVIACIENMNG